MRQPCTRGLSAFKDGCPKRPWDGESGDGCPLWLEKDVPKRENPMIREPLKACIDVWQFEVNWAQLGLLEGNQAAIEQLRNGLLFYDEEKKTVSPKPDYAMRELVKMIKAQQLMLEGEGRPLTIINDGE